MLYSLIYAWPFVVFVVDEILSDLSCERFRGGIISKECGSKLDHGVLLVGYGQSGGGDVINEWVHGNPWKSWKPCAPEIGWWVLPSRPSPLKTPFRNHGGMVVLHLLGWPKVRSAAGQAYWIIKNSWGLQWGEDGVLLPRNRRWLCHRTWTTQINNGQNEILNNEFFCFPSVFQHFPHYLWHLVAMAKKSWNNKSEYSKGRMRSVAGGMSTDVMGGRQEALWLQFGFHHGLYFNCLEIMISWYIW